MLTTLTKADVERIAALAHLELSEDEKNLFTRQLADIITYAQQIQQIDTSGVPPTLHIVSSQQELRPDKLRISLSKVEALANAPETDPGTGLFKVPKVIG